MSMPSFEEVAQELKVQLYAYLRRMTGNTADADDLLQETFMRIAHGLSGFKGKSSVKTWAFRIATNTAVDFLRRSKKVKFVEFSEADDVADADKDDDLVLDEMNTCIRGVIDTLPPDYRSVLVLTNFQDTPVEETARICGISVSAAKVRIHRAKARLKKALDKKCDYYQAPGGDLRCDRKTRRA